MRKIDPNIYWNEVPAQEGTYRVAIKDDLICSVPEESGWEIKSVCIGRETLYGTDPTRMIVEIRKVENEHTD